VSYSDLVRKTWDENHLFSALLELTYRCNLDCFFCYNDLELQGKPLTLEQYLRILEDLRDLGTLHLTLSGGEPLAHPDFFAIGAAAREMGFVIRVKSNGHAVYGPLLRRLKHEVEPFAMDISLHGATAATHDRQTRVAGSFDRLMRNLEEIKASGISIKLNCTLTSWNENEVEAIYALADRIGLRLSFAKDVSPVDNGDTTPLSILASDEGMRRLLAIQQGRPSSVAVTPPGEQGKRAATVSKQCGAGSSSVAIDPYGNVYPCVQWRRPLGNLHETTMGSIWNGSRELDRIRTLTGEAKALTDSLGPAGRRIGFCAGLAELTGGSPTTLYPEARRKLRLIEDLANGSS
jgi:MoaA/NifB/PqqE/SkfB family radical SAM enzyme